ncbi:nucleoporin NDC1 [bacterium]|mgnify:CR=1 FL=1|jgi:hypothetical protein|nr:nucleoporin NDC1 [bacterium]
MYELYSLKEKLYFLLCGLIIMGCVVWVTHIAWEYRVINQQWDQEFTTPKEFWSKVPRAIQG